MLWPPDHDRPSHGERGADTIGADRGLREVAAVVHLGLLGQLKELLILGEEEELEAALVGEHDAVSSLTQGTVEFQKIGKGELTKQLVLIEHDLERLLRERGRFGREGVCLAF